MKHFTLLVVILTMLAWQGISQTLNQAAAWPNAAWTLSGTYNAAALLNDPTSSANLSYDDDAAGSGSTDILVATSPVIDLTAAAGAGETWLNVDYAYDYNLGNTFNLEWYDADGASWVVWDAIADNSGTTSNWCATAVAATSSTLDIAALTATQLSGFQYRFNYDASSTWGWGMCVSSPTITSAAPPACLDATALTATAITSSSADLGWTDNAGAGLFNVEYDVAGFTLGSGTQIMGTTNNPEGVSGLTPQTTYEFYVQVDCGGGNTSTWVGPYSFTTACASVVAPWIESFETTVVPTCWNTGGVTAWEFGSTATGGFAQYGAANVLDHSVSGTGSFIGIDGSDNTNGEVSTLLTPFIDVTALTTPQVKYYVFSDNTNDAAQNLLEVEVWDGSAWTLVETIQTNNPGWVEYTTTLGAGWTLTGDIQVRFTITGVSNGGSTFYNDIVIDDVEVLEAPTCPAPSNLTLVASDLTSGDFSWTPSGSETEWELEWGAPGFTQGTGTAVMAGPTPDGSITGLTSNMFYDVYVRAVCTPGVDTSFYVGPITFNTYDQGLFMEVDNDCGVGFIDISGNASATATGLLYSGEIDVALPFDLLFQGTLAQNATISSSGHIYLEAAPGSVTATFNTTIANSNNGLYPFHDALEADFGDVYYETIGTAPNRTFIIQWEDNNYLSGPAGEVVTFQIQIDEATNEIYYLYEDVVFGGSDVFYDYGNSATVGLAGPSQDFELSYNDPAYLTDNSCVHFYYTDCPKPINFSVTYTTVDEAAITWNAGLAGETDWTVIYGPAGFDPTVSGTTVNTTTPALIFPGLDDITTYDVYIYADCNPGVLQSVGATGSFTTLPNCADVTGLTASTASDSIFTSWSFVENPGFPSTGFDIEYGYTGYTQGMGTLVNADNNYTDTTADVSLLSGALYDVYVQTICGTDSSSFVGPFTVTMPLDNDSTCLAENLMVDGTLYTFDKTGASVQVSEAGIIPPVTGYQTNDGWGQTGLHFSTWFTFDAPASGSIRVDGTDQNFAGQMAVYEVTDCGDFATFTLLGANDNAVPGGSSAPNFTVCGLTPGNTYYLMHDANSTTSTTSNGGIYSVAISEVVVEGGLTSGLIDVCIGDTVELFDGITGYDMGGTWTQETPTLGLNGSSFVTAGLAYQVFNFEYEVVDGCATDSVIQQVQIYGPSSAGTDGTITACQNEPIDLLAGLGGNVDLGGTWYDPSNTATSSDIIASNIPGSFNYDYITGNGVCPDDTANVIVSVDPSCDYLSIEEVAFDNMTIFPNPTNGSVFVTNEGSNEVFNFELTDVNGKVITAQNAAINGTETTEVSLVNLESGFYLIRVFNDNADKTFRIIKE